MFLTDQSSLHKLVICHRSARGSRTRCHYKHNVSTPEVEEENESEGASMASLHSESKSGNEIISVYSSASRGIHSTPHYTAQM